MLFAAQAIPQHSLWSKSMGERTESQGGRLRRPTFAAMRAAEAKLARRSRGGEL